MYFGTYMTIKYNYVVKLKVISETFLNVINKNFFSTKKINYNMLNIFKPNLFLQK